MGIATFRLAREREAAKLKVASLLLEQKKVKKPKKSKTNGNLNS